MTAVWTPRRGAAHRPCGTLSGDERDEAAGSAPLDVVVPVLAALVLAVTWGSEPGDAVLAVAPRRSRATPVRRGDDHLQRDPRPVLLLATLRHRVASFNDEGTATALATVAALATPSLVLPSFTTSGPGAEFTAAQLAFAAVASIALYGLFVVVQTVRHRDYFLPVGPAAADPEEHAEPPSDRAALASLGLLVVALVAVVGAREG